MTTKTIENTKNGVKINWKWACALFGMMIGWAVMDVYIDRARASLVEKYPETQKVLCSGKVDNILIEKSKKTMTLFDEYGCVVKKYNVVTGKNPGPKQCDGDKRTPEGIYHIVEKRDSKYHKFLALDYPNAKDRKVARELGCKPGDSIGIHSWIEGLPMDGSLGCIRVKTKAEILEVNKLVKVGTRVKIVQ